MFTVYILSCSDGSYHIGITKDLIKRLKYHQSGKNKDAITFSRLPFSLFYQQDFGSIQTAIIFEKEIRKLDGNEISKLVNGEISISYPKELSNSISEKTNEKTISLSTSYMGNIAYLSPLINAKKQKLFLSIDGEERYEKQTYRSRCTILSANGIQNLVVPVIRPNGKNTKVKDVLISYVENWQKDHIKALESAYRRSPFFEFYSEELFSILEKKHVHLVDLNMEVTALILRCFGVDCKISLSTKETALDIEMKKKMLPKSRELFRGKEYHQTFNGENGFENNLSSLDLLFNVGKAYFQFI